MCMLLCNVLVHPANGGIHSTFVYDVWLISSVGSECVSALSDYMCDVCRFEKKNGYVFESVDLLLAIVWWIFDCSILN